MSSQPLIIKTFLSKLNHVALVSEDGIVFMSPSLSFIEYRPATSSQHRQLNIDINNNIAQNTPIHLIFLANENPLNIDITLTIADNKSVTLYEHHFNKSHLPIHINFNTHLKPGAKLNHINITESALNTTFHANRNVIITENAHLDFTQALFTGMLTQHVHTIKLTGQNASAKVKTIATTSHNHQANIKTVIEHLAIKTQGLIEHYGVALDESKLVFEGIGHIHKNMKKSIARQINRGIIQGLTARLDANPLLLIDEYDVEASHGATIGQIDENQLYYLMSRGLRQKEAERLIINGFFAPLREALVEEVLINHLEHLIQTKIV